MKDLISPDLPSESRSRAAYSLLPCMASLVFGFFQELCNIRWSGGGAWPLLGSTPLLNRIVEASLGIFVTVSLVSIHHQVDQSTSSARTYFFLVDVICSYVQKVFKYTLRARLWTSQMYFILLLSYVPQSYDRICTFSSTNISIYATPSFSNIRPHNSQNISTFGIFHHNDGLSDDAVITHRQSSLS